MPLLIGVADVYRRIRIKALGQSAYAFADEAVLPRLMAIGKFDHCALANPLHDGHQGRGASNATWLSALRPEAV